MPEPAGGSIAWPELSSRPPMASCRWPLAAANLSCAAPAAPPSTPPGRAVRSPRGPGALRRARGAPLATSAEGLPSLRGVSAAVSCLVLTARRPASLEQGPTVPARQDASPLLDSWDLALAPTGRPGRTRVKSPACVPNKPWAPPVRSRTPVRSASLPLRKLRNVADALGVPSPSLCGREVQYRTLPLSATVP
ncbi:unnamed protein product [Prorocentrum cordatum]|uniref:Uncharacterized protein n=1 Tax=Prorocentrum cordatum TaxID=2364126 RepID=A0ABN9RMQ3_9DINO|nr:unnamed protein product [Polarella glacialis]